MDADLLLSLPQGSTVKNINYTLFLMMFFLRWVLQDWGHCRSMGNGRRNDAANVTVSLSPEILSRDSGQTAVSCADMDSLQAQLYILCLETYCASFNLNDWRCTFTAYSVHMWMMHIFTISRIFPLLAIPPLGLQGNFSRISILNRCDKTYCGAGEESTEGVNSNAKIAKNECFTFGFCIFLYVVEIVRFWIS